MMDMHNHTTWSRDAHNSPKQLIDNAISIGINVLGISDHHRSVLMGHTDRNKLKCYVIAIKKLQHMYSDQINIMTGLELNVNFFSDEAKEFPFDMMKELDYVLLEHVDGAGLLDVTPHKDCVKLADIKQIREKLKDCKFVGLAHTDLLYLAEKYSKGTNIEYGIDKVVKTLAENDIFWEINVQPHYEYFDYILGNKDNPKVQYLFKKLKEYSIKVTAATDSHLICGDFSYEDLMAANKIASSINPLF
jgi:histidinol phosphatase-like PHP family hydrolase